ncbi:hypothetical protein BJ138DRAFT_1165467 [Hygrophoropsis aurantiaca]|uniref:Uncharacterized protein n=1 Tax=Hygrophoropsis aurantiaca TaxID=72124 RepID=A0ACB7ZWH0_9AGAM|nr:hypothetical protein BJ138DRAFT_1165467 [Hygrophoropsis aurantiaca]
MPIAVTSTIIDQGKITEIRSGGATSSVVFEQDGTHIVSGSRDETIRKWRAVDGQEVGQAMRAGKRVNAVAVSRDGRWMACGMDNGLIAVWDASTHEKVIGVNGHRDDVDAVDISPDSQTFATGSRDKMAFIWNITTGRKLVGPLKHEGNVSGVKFSPQGDHIATATWYSDKSIRIFDSHSGDLLTVIPDAVLSGCSTPIAWSNDGQQIFAVHDGKIKELNVSTASLLSEWPVHGQDNNASLALANHGRFIAYSTSTSVSLWDTSTHAQLGPLIEHTGKVMAIALSPDSTCLASGQSNRKITLRDLRSILPDSYFVTTLAPSTQDTTEALCTVEEESGLKQSVISQSSSAVPISQIPFMQIIDTAFEAWVQDELEKAEAIFTQKIMLAQNPNHHLLANRALLRARLQGWEGAINDAEKSIEIQPSVIGYIAKSVALVGDGRVKDGYRACDLAFAHCDSNDVDFLLLVKSIIICVAEDYEDAMLRVSDLITIAEDKSIYYSVQAHMHFLLGSAQLARGEQESAVQSFTHAQQLASRWLDSPRLRMISLVFGWSFEDLYIRIQRGLCEALYTAGRTHEAISILRKMMDRVDEGVQPSRRPKDWITDFTQPYISTLENIADAALGVNGYEEAIAHYASALSARPAAPIPILRKWVKARLTSTSWRETLGAAVEFSLKVPKFSIYQVICDVLEDSGRVTEAVECFHELTSDLEDKAAPDARYKWELAFKHRCGEKLQICADAAMQAQQYDEAIEQYSSALSFQPPNADVLLIKRSKARTMNGSWEGALEDANKVIELVPSSPWGYERKQSALHGAGKYSDAIVAQEMMLSVMAESPNPQIRGLCERYIHPSKVKATIPSLVQLRIRELPRVLIDTISGRLCDAAKLVSSFEASTIYSQLVSSMTAQIDHSRIRKAIADYYKYAMFSHNWDRNEPLFQMVEPVSIYDLERSPTHDKLQNFCWRVRDTGFRWAWSDTCCIDKKDLTVLQESLVSMFKWYRSSAMTLVYLRGVGRRSGPGGLADSPWNSRAWTYQEYVAAEVVQFYTEDWTPYLDMPISDGGQQLVNHKASQAIIQEMQQAINREVGDKDWPELQPGLDHIREKLCLASTRQTTYIEDAAYSLFGILSTSIPVIYGEGEDALGRFLAQVLMTSRDVSILAWTGESSRYNSCLPARIAVFKELATSHLPSPFDESSATDLPASFPDVTSATSLYDRVNNLPRPWFAGQCMHLPCVTFQLGPLQGDQVDGVHVYRARTAALGVVKIRTKNPIPRSNALYLIHPWINTFRDQEAADSTPFVEELGLPPPHLELDGGLLADEDFETLPSSAPARSDTQTRAIRLVARLQQPFGALLLKRSPNGVEYRRVAADANITVRVQKNTPLTHLLENIRTLEVL